MASGYRLCASLVLSKSQHALPWLVLSFSCSVQAAQLLLALVGLARLVAVLPLAARRGLSALGFNLFYPGAWQRPLV